VLGLGVLSVPRTAASLLTEVMRRFYADAVGLLHLRRNLYAQANNTTGFGTAVFCEPPEPSTPA
jgi:hypothetical protein